jgi:hypothetical protein
LTLALKGAWSGVLHKSIHASAAIVVGFHMIVKHAVGQGCSLERGDGPVGLRF